MRGIHRSPVDSPRKDAGNLSRHRAHYYVTVMRIAEWGNQHLNPFGARIYIYIYIYIYTRDLTVVITVSADVVLGHQLVQCWQKKLHVFFSRSVVFQRFRDTFTTSSKIADEIPLNLVALRVLRILCSPQGPGSFYFRHSMTSVRNPCPRNGCNPPRFHHSESQKHR